MKGNTTQAANPVSFRKITYDPILDFAPITLTAVVPLVLFAAPKHNIHSFGELLALAKSRLAS